MAITLPGLIPERQTTHSPLQKHTWQTLPARVHSRSSFSLNSWRTSNSSPTSFTRTPASFSPSPSLIAGMFVITSTTTDFEVLSLYCTLYKCKNNNQLIRQFKFNHLLDFPALILRKGNKLTFDLHIKCTDFAPFNFSCVKGQRT